MSRKPADYMSGGRVNSSSVSGRELAAEFLLNTLRLTSGFRFELFQQRTSLDPQMLMPFIEKATARGLLIYDGDWVKPTPLGQRFLNDLLLMFEET